MPFGLDLKSIIVGVILYAFVFPWVMGMLNRPHAQSKAA